MRKTICLLLLMITFAISLVAQSITGTVRDETGKVMPFATVSVKDRMMSVTTDSKIDLDVKATSGK